MQEKKKSLAVIGVGNMATAIIKGIISSEIDISSFYLFDTNKEKYRSFTGDEFIYCDNISEAVENATCVLLSVKPQNYEQVLSDLSEISGYENKLYISIAAGISVEAVNAKLIGASVVRVLPNVPMLIGQGVSVICENSTISPEEFQLVCSIFKSSGSILIINEVEMNRIIGVTSSSPAYVFKFIDSIYKGALAQGVTDNGLLDTICDMVIGSALLLKQSDDTPQELIKKVASKGGTTERALATLDEYCFEDGIKKAMIACTDRADELGNKK